MDFLSILTLVLLIIAIFWFVQFTLNLDCDYTLTFLEKFGRSPGESAISIDQNNQLIKLNLKLKSRIESRPLITFNTASLLSTATLNGKVVWITGSSAGIGQAIAFELAKAGCKLILSGTKVDRLHTVKKECLGELLSKNFWFYRRLLN